MSINTRRKVLITDLDQSDTQAGKYDESHRKVHKKRTKDKNLQTLSGNFNRRSYSAEGLKQDSSIGKSAKKTSYINELVSIRYYYNSMP